MTAADDFDPFVDATGRPRRAGALMEIGLAVRLDGDVLRGTVEIVPEMYVPGTDCLRTSILAVWADMLTGLYVTDVFAPRVPVTLELSLDLPQPARALTRVEGSARILKSGRSVVAADVEFTADGRSTPVAIGTASFMAAPDVSLELPSLLENVHRYHRGQGRLTIPLAERVQCERRGPGVASVPRTDDTINASNTINGGLLALVAEEAVLSGAPEGTTLAALAMRYMRPARIGPAVATATRYGDVARVEVHDSGAHDRLVVNATTRVFPG